jgi:hypothetical protein
MRFSSAALAVALPLVVSAAPIRRQATVAPLDIVVLQFAEVLERLEAQFYTEALDKFQDQDFVDAGIAIPDVARQGFQGILDHENAHAIFLQEALQATGGAPVDGCVFNFDDVLGDVATMAVVARVVEAVGVGAYLGASILVEDKNILLAAASILTIEARHQSFLNTINGATNVPQAFDIALTPQQVLALAGGFISGCSFEGAGVVANKALSLTNDGPVGPGTRLTFDFDGIEGLDEDNLSCQMIVGGQPTALSFPIADCVVPQDINGPVAIFITDDEQPLATDLTVQNGAIIVAGPTIAFLDIIPDTLGSLVRSGGAPVESSEDLDEGEAQAELENPNNLVGGADATSSSSSAGALPTNAVPENAAAAPVSTPPIKVIGQHSIPA